MFGLFKKKKKVKERSVEEPKKATIEDKEKEEVVVQKTRKASNHITKHPSGGWQIKKSNSERALKRFKTQKEAIAFAKGLEDTTGTGYIIHKADGKTRKKTY